MGSYHCVLTATLVKPRVTLPLSLKRRKIRWVSGEKGNISGGRYKNPKRRCLVGKDRGGDAAVRRRQAGAGLWIGLTNENTDGQARASGVRRYRESVTRSHIHGRYGERSRAVGSRNIYDAVAAGSGCHGHDVWHRVAEAERRRVLSPEMIGAGSVLAQSKLNGNRLDPLGQLESTRR